MSTLQSSATPQLECLHRGKVRDSYRIDPKTRLIVATDRLSAFDRVLETGIPGKGAVLTRLAAFWFERTRGIVENHMHRVIGSRAMLVREAQPILIEMVVRGYLTGSSWRKYREGVRTISGVPLPEGLSKNDRFSTPILTPTTKDVHDTEISPDEIVARGLIDWPTYEKMASLSLQLFEEGTAHLASHGILLVDTKYEFGLVDGALVLIDEIHTPDSSRFWAAEEYAADAGCVEACDKEFVRGWLLKEQATGRDPVALPAEIVEETTRRYREICERITETALPPIPRNPRSELIEELVAAGLVKDGVVGIVMGSPSDRAHAEKIAKIIRSYDIAVRLHVASAHKTPEAVAALASAYSAACEPCALVAVAGLSNGLGGALAANATVPVINCPPFKNDADFLANINSSLMMPSKTPAATTVRPDNAALAALRGLNIGRLRDRFADEIELSRAGIAAADLELRETP